MEHEARWVVSTGSMVDSMERYALINISILIMPFKNSNRAIDVLCNSVIAEVIAGVILGPSVMGRIPGFTQVISQ